MRGVARFLSGVIIVATLLLPFYYFSIISVFARGMSSANGAPQQAAVAAEGLFWLIAPYVVLRSIEMAVNRMTYIVETNPK